MRATLVIPGTLPNLNDYITAERRHRQAAAAMKRHAEQVVALAASRLRVQFAQPVMMHYRWIEPNRRRDKDNISSFGRKVIQDALVRLGVLKNDGWAEVDSFTDTFDVDKSNPRIEVEIIAIDIIAKPTRPTGQRGWQQGR